jgi:hypothetical protein
MAPAGQGRLLGRHDVQYFLCPGCGLLQTEAPYWLEEAYSSAISRTDLGLVQRNVETFRKISPVIFDLHGPDARVLDSAGGYGMLARMLRDAGFDAYTEDAYCENLLCGPFAPPEGRAMDVVCAIEVMEHLMDPLQFLREKIEERSPSTLIFSTVTYPGPTPPPADWWYYCPENGQHITFFQPRSIEALAARLGFVYTRLRADLHLFTRTPPRSSPRALRGRGLAGRLLARRTRRGMRGRSRLPEDYATACQAANADLASGDTA